MYRNGFLSARRKYSLFADAQLYDTKRTLSSLPSMQSSSTLGNDFFTKMRSTGRCVSWDSDDDADDSDLNRDLNSSLTTVVRPHYCPGQFHFKKVQYFYFHELAIISSFLIID